jgi:anhydro-N-acetylmuramic acid kinase
VGDAALLSRETGVPVAHDFRSADVAAGGEGAPMAPIFHAALARGLPRPLAVLNIGGVANATWIGHRASADRKPGDREAGDRERDDRAHGDRAPGDRASGNRTPWDRALGNWGTGGNFPGEIADDDDLIAFDTGPGNGPLDDWASRHTGQRFDRDGALGLSGTVDTAVLGRLMAHRYFSRPPPKSLDRLEFSKSLAESGLDALAAADGAATLAAFTAASVAASPFPAPPSRWLVSGGGRHNPAIMAALRTALRAPVDPVETVGWNGDALEAQCFGFLAARVARSLPLSFPTTTGVPAPMPGGRIVTG